MQSAEKNHPCEKIFAGRDEIGEEESSLGEIFIRRDEISGKESSPEENSCWQRCNQQRKIILGREFLLAEMQSAEKNHPRKRVLIRRDAISKEESSLGENFCWQG